MRNYEIENEMYRRAVELIQTRYPVGWGGAGVVHTANGNYYTSVSIETANASAIVCIELGAMLEAHKYNEKVTHCMCLIRDDEGSDFRVLSPCGICQERLRYWGEDVQVADGKVGPVAQKLYDNLYGMQCGAVEDFMGWTYPLGF